MNTTLAQSENERLSMLDCWPCIVASKNNDPSLTIEECKYTAQKFDGSTGGEIAQLIIARQLLEQKHFEEALRKLEQVVFENKTLQSIALGLQGDCQSELKNYKPALDLYQKASLHQRHNFFSPYFLFKGYCVAEQLDDHKTAQRFIKCIEDYFNGYADINNLKVYRDPTIVVSKPIVIDMTAKSASEFDSLGIGTINDVLVSKNEFEDLIEKTKETIRQNNLQGYASAPYDEDIVWERFIESIVLRNEYTSISLFVDEEELYAYFYATDGFSILPDLGAAFSDNDGNFNRRLLQARIEELQNSENPEMRKAWELSRKYYIEQRSKEKYLDILRNGVYATNLETLKKFHAKNDEFLIDYSRVLYSSIPDELIEPSEKEIDSYYELLHSDPKYQNPYDTRSIRYTTISLVPSQSDSLRFFTKLDSLSVAFEHTNDDSLFVMQHSERKEFNRTLPHRPKSRFSYYGEIFPDEMEQTFMDAKVGSIVGPYKDGNVYKLAKVLHKKEQYITARHILIAVNRNDLDAVAIAQARADSIGKLIDHENFDSFVRRYSDDPGTRYEGGIYKDFVPGDMVKEFDNFAINASIGEIGIVHTDFGFHIMEVLERKPSGVANLAIVELTLKPGSETIENIKHEATSLLQEFSTALSAVPNEERVSAFNTLAYHNNFLVRSLTVKDKKPVVNNLSDEHARNEVYRFLFSEETNPGDLLPVPIIDSNRIWIGIFSESSKQGFPSYNKAKLLMKTELLDARKADFIQKEWSSLKPEQDKETIVLENFTGKHGGDNYLKGAVSRMQSNNQQMYVGRAGVYNITLTHASVTKEPKDLDPFRNELETEILSNFRGSIIRDLVDRANVIDNRILFRAGIRN